jgi:AcrR family transcriptional regulator
MPRPARQPATVRGRRAAKQSEGAPAPKRTQRERLLEAMVELSASAGYQAASIAQLSSRAGVSSATFYEQFDGKEDCFVAAYRMVTERMLEQLEPVAADTVATDEEWSQAARMALGRLLSAIQRDPDGGRVLYIESMAGGPLMLEERRRVLETFEGRAQNLLDSTPRGDSTLDLPAASSERRARSSPATCARTPRTSCRRSRRTSSRGCRPTPCPPASSAGARGRMRC